MSTYEARLRERAEPTTRDALTQNVVRGIALLTDHDPYWRKKIALSRLDMMSCTACILGQLFGSYEEGLLILDISESDLPELYGFRTSYDPRTLDAESYGALQAAWIARLN